jgi:hypothetical protein
MEFARFLPRRRVVVRIPFKARTTERTSLLRMHKTRSLTKFKRRLGLLGIDEISSRPEPRRHMEQLQDGREMPWGKWLLAASQRNPSIKIASTSATLKL